MRKTQIQQETTVSRNSFTHSFAFTARFLILGENLQEGTLKETQRLLRRAATAAIHSNQGRIDLKLLKGLGWTRPSLRRREAEAKLERAPFAI